jgi:hypothetical protein
MVWRGLAGCLPLWPIWEWGSGKQFLWQQHNESGTRRQPVPLIEDDQSYRAQGQSGYFLDGLLRPVDLHKMTALPNQTISADGMGFW